jgi:hypothetical protein
MKFLAWMREQIARENEAAAVAAAAEASLLQDH